MNRNLIIAGSVLVVAVVIYFVWKSRKKSPTTATPPPTGGPQPGGAFAPKILTEEDYTKLETVFKESNPFNADLAKKIEGQGIDENEPTKLDGTQKVLLTKSQFDNLVLAKIRRLIGQRSSWVQDEENRRFEEWRGAVRAGYANSLAQALAFAVRTDTAINNYYTGSGSGSGSGTSSGNISEMYNQYFTGSNEDLKSLDWKPTNIPNIIYAKTFYNPPTLQYFDVANKVLIKQESAKMRGVSQQYLSI